MGVASVSLSIPIPISLLSSLRSLLRVAFDFLINEMKSSVPLLYYKAVMKQLDVRTPRRILPQAFHAQQSRH